MSKIRCAIYVRKSTEKGLELEFNSLHNQEEACKNYILSQSFQGWEFAKTYVDFGISGGTMERPALKQMLDDMSRGLVNVVVVYKVDRLSRSIMDFHNMMKVFDKYNCNFVSITQSFDTSNSMGKLTLNMLLSFAQFEREVSSERVRDKIRASRAKGIWTGGVPFLGYNCVDKKLVINPTEAEQVRTVFELYLELGSVADLAMELRTRGIVNKKWITHDGKVKGGAPIATMSLHRILRERIYVGELQHKSAGTATKGEHDAIISNELFDAVQERIRKNSSGKTGRSNGSQNLLSGKVYNSSGVVFFNQKTYGKNKNIISYYASKGFYIPATDLDKLTIDTVREFMDSDVTALSPEAEHIIKQIDFANMPYLAQRQFIKTLIDRAIYTTSKITFFINTNPDSLSPFINQNNNPLKFIINDGTVIIEKDIVINKGIATNKYNAGRGGIMTMTENNHLIVRAFAMARKYKELYEKHGDLRYIKKTENVTDRTIYRYLNLAYLPPPIVNKVMSGKIKCSVDDLFKISAEHVGITDRLV